MLRSAILSEDGRFRYELSRRWSERPTVGWVMCNPSTADADVDDPTIRRCIDFSQRWGYGALIVRNVYAFRATDPKDLVDATDRWGPLNGLHLRLSADEDMTICAWGNNVAAADARAVRQMIAAAGSELAHLGLTKSGQPKHPLYLAAITEPIHWDTPIDADNPDDWADVDTARRILFGSPVTPTDKD